MCAFITGVGIIADAILPLIAPPEHLSWLRWRIPIIVAGVAAIVALGVQLYLQNRQENEDRKQRLDADKTIEALSQDIGKLTGFLGSREQLNKVDDGLHGKVLSLAQDLFAFLREKGPKPNPRLSKWQPWDEMYHTIVDARGPYVEAIHYGYLARFKERALSLFYELQEHGIKDLGIEEWEVNPPQVASERTIRKVAERLFMIAAKMGIDEASKGT